jgi:hypothetical protein
MMGGPKTWLAGLLWAMLAPATVEADEGPAWTVISTGRWLIKTRPVPNTPARDFWAEGEFAAPVQDIQSTLMEHEHFPRFMPLLKESRTIGQPLDDGSMNVYTRIEPPVVSSRDYVVRVHLVESVREDGSGNFRNQWKSVNELLPERANVVRLKINEGSWYVTPVGDGSRSWAVYKFRTEPGGWIPPFLADLANKTGVTDTLTAVEKEAKRRHKERTAQSGR